MHLTHRTIVTIKLCYMLSRFSHVWFFATLWTVAGQAFLSMGFSRQEYWSGLPCPPPRDLPDPGIEPPSLRTPALAGGFFTTSTTWEAQVKVLITNSWQTLGDPMDYSPPGSSVHGISQARILEGVATSFSRASSQLRDQIQVTCIAGRFFTIWATSWKNFEIPFS